jgi:hypothetical protein
VKVFLAINEPIKQLFDENACAKTCSFAFDPPLTPAA